MASAEGQLEIINLVHNLASLSWNDSLSGTLSDPSTTSSSSSLSSSTNNFNSFPNTASPTGGTSTTSNCSNIHRISPSSSNKPTAMAISNSGLIFNTKKSKSNNTATTTNASPGRRIQPVSIPRKPPDIQNLSLFPPIGQENLDKTPCFPNTHTKMKPNTASSALDDRMTKQTSTMTSPTSGQNQGQSSSPDGCSAINQQRKSIPLTIPEIKSDPNPDPNDVNTKKVKAPRSASLLTELTPQIISQVDQVAQEYSSLLDNNMCRSVLEELTFLFQLISSTKSQPLTPTIDPNSNTKLASVAQQVYFVIKVLYLQLNSSLLSVDPQIIQLLVEKYPHRIPRPVRKHFQQWVAAQVQKKEKLLKLINSGGSSSQKPSEFHHCVTFRSETDGRSNFPCQGDFHAFCKQRDLFYSIKNLWAQKEDCGGISNTLISRIFTNSTKSGGGGGNKDKDNKDLDPLCSKIKSLFQMNSSWANLSHFASLFTSQFLIDSLEETSKKSGDSETDQVQDEQMRNLQQSNPDRFAKLNSRMSSPSEVKQDYFEFQNYFVKIAGSPQFNQHLVDRITFEILEVESTIETADSISPEELQILIKKSILLSKLLGYLIFLPYNDQGPSSTNPNFRSQGPGPLLTLEKEALLSKQLELRKYQQPPLDLKNLLIKSIQQHRLTFTLPWVIEFLSSAADTVSLQLPKYQETLSLISCIYQSVLKVENGRLLPYFSLINKNFLRFFCGNLFTCDKFPVELFGKDDEGILKEVDAAFSNNVKHGIVSSRDTEMKEDDDADENVPLDSMDFVGERLLGFYFNGNFAQMKYILHVGLQQKQESGSSDSTSAPTSVAKHIRPIPAKSPMKSAPLLISDPNSNQKLLQRQLELSFFDGNAPSVKKTVDFIADRIASNYVKLLRKLMTDYRAELVLQSLFEEDAAIICKQKMLEGLDEFAGTKTELAVSLLIAESVSNPALKMCQQIAKRECIAKVGNWVDSHIKSEMFPEVPVPKVNEVVQPPKSEIVQPIHQSLNFNSMILLHRWHKKLHQLQPIPDHILDEILNSTSLGECSGMLNTLIDFGLALVTFCPTMLTPERQMKLVNLWGSQFSPDILIICPRNLMILRNNRDQPTEAESWSKLAQIVSKLIKEDVLDLYRFTKDCFALLKEGLPTDEFNKVTGLLKEIYDYAAVDLNQRHEEKYEKMKYLFSLPNNLSEFVPFIHQRHLTPSDNATLTLTNT